LNPNPAGLEDLGAELDGAPPVPPRPARRPGVPGGPAKRPPAGVKPPGGPSVFTKKKTENLVHPGVDASGKGLTLLAAAQEIETLPEFGDYKIVSMRENPDGSFSATVQLK
jgi:hypothetical protein